jgi:hypothetical protein
MRENIFKALAELSERYPGWRFRQTVANVSFWPTSDAIWDVEDEQFLRAEGSWSRGFTISTGE